MKPMPSSTNSLGLSMKVMQISATSAIFYAIR
ncbi:Uncharacterised protein [Vibrio cholerae]|nr:Uncharacterised protein [Vibrio cholerae]